MTAVAACCAIAIATLAWAGFSLDANGSTTVTPLPMPAAEARHINAVTLPARHPDQALRLASSSSSNSLSAKAVLPEPARLGAPLPKLKSPGTPELDAAMLPILSSVPDAAELARLKDAILAIYRKKLDQARSIASGLKDPVTQKLVAFYLLTSDASGARPEDIEAFRRANPDWPGGVLRTRAEEALLVDAISPERVRAFFKDNPPQTGAGMAALAAAHLQAGDKARSRELAVTTWREHDLNPSVEAAILDQLGSLLTKADHKWRADRFLYADSRWSGTRDIRIAAAKRAAKLLDEAEQKKINARIAAYDCYRSAKGCRARADKLLGALGDEGLKDWGIYYHRLQWLRRQDQDEAAAKMLLSAPTDPKLVVSPDDWWIERQVQAYRALYRKQPKVAYDLVKAPGPVSTNPANESSFMAGWISLRFLNKPKQALTHFLAMSATADGPITRSTSNYWLYRTYQELGNTGEGKRHLEAAAKEFGTFYGQLARQTLNPKDGAMPIQKPAAPARIVAQRFGDNDAIKALVIAARADLASLSRLFINHLRGTWRTQEELTLLAHSAVTIGDTQMGVRIGKTAQALGFDLITYAYPIHAMPDFEPLRPLPEMAMFYAIARQESEFNTLITSGAGARGILQVMRITADHVCDQYKIARSKCGTQRLSDDPPFNARLATAYIADRNEQFSGSYVLTMPAYNAGPGRANYWIRNIGDPRDRSIDPIDWIELIHIKETRDYTKKVLANLQVYRARLGEEANALRLLADIERARR